MKNKAFSICLSFIIMLGFLQSLSGIGHTAAGTLEWDPSESDITGYKLYYGTDAGDYNQVIDVENVTTYQVSDLEDGVIYFAVKAYAYDTDGIEIESKYSNEIRVRFVDGSWVNDPPIADAGPDQTVYEETTVTLNGSNSTDPDNGIAAYLWTQTTGTPVTLSDPISAQTIFMSPDVGPSGETLTFQLTTTDNDGLQTTDTCIVNISWLNEPPMADAGPDQTVAEKAMVTLDGSNSTDPDDGIFAYLWTQTAGSAVTLSDPTSVQPTFTAPRFKPNKKTFTFQLTVTDEGGLQATDSCTVNVTRGNGNEPPIADAGPDQTVFEQTVVTLDGSNSTDPDDGIAAYLWTQTMGFPVTLSDPTSVQPTFTAPGVGPGGEALTFRLTVTDGGGLQGTDECTVSVTGLDGVTVISVTPDTVQAGGSIDVTITGSGFVDGAVVSFENGSGPAPTASNTVVLDEQTISSTVTAGSGGPPRNRVWDVAVTNPDSSSGVLIDGFTVTP